MQNIYQKQPDDARAQVWGGAALSAALYFAMIDFTWVLISLTGGTVVC